MRDTVFVFVRMMNIGMRDSVKILKKKNNLFTEWDITYILFMKTNTK